MRVCSTRICGLVGLVDRLLLQELALQVLQLLLLGAEGDVGGAAGALEHPDDRGALVLQRGLLAVEVEEPLLARAPAGRGGESWLSGSAAMFAVLKSAIFFDCVWISPVSRSTSPLKKSRVSLARSVRIRVFSWRMSETSSFAPLVASGGVGREEVDADDRRARRAGLRRRVGLEADELDPGLHVADDLAGREVGLVGVEADALRHVVEVGPRHQPLLDDLDLLVGIDLGRAAAVSEICCGSTSRLAEDW